MVRLRNCLSCDGTGMTKKGFCHECKGMGHHETIKPGNKQANDMLLLLASVRKHTNEDQFNNILNDYFLSES